MMHQKSYYICFMIIFLKPQKNNTKVTRHTAVKQQQQLQIMMMI